MGFYLPAQLIQDARRHQVQVDAIDVLCSQWDSTLENTATGTPSVRLGLSLLSGMHATSARRIMVARQSGTFSDVADLARRAELNRHDLHILAAGNALKSLAGHRRQALWQAVGALPERDLLRPTTIEEALPQLSAPSLADEIAHDYHTQGLSLQGHPLSLLRPQLLAQRFLPAELLNTFANGQFARGCGIITMRQRPGTANGVIFITLEDETGSLNVIIWPSLFEQERRLILSTRLLGVYGIWQCENEVRHLIAKRLVDLTSMLGSLKAGSRDFH